MGERTYLFETLLSIPLAIYTERRDCWVIRGSPVFSLLTCVFYTVFRSSFAFLPSCRQRGAVGGGVPDFSTPLPTLATSVFLDNGHPRGCEVIAHCGCDF